MDLCTLDNNYQTSVYVSTVSRSISGFRDRNVERRMALLLIMLVSA